MLKLMLNAYQGLYTFGLKLDNSVYRTAQFTPFYRPDYFSARPFYLLASHDRPGPDNPRNPCQGVIGAVKVDKIQFISHLARFN